MLLAGLETERITSANSRSLVKGRLIAALREASTSLRFSVDHRSSTVESSWTNTHPIPNCAAARIPL